MAERTTPPAPRGLWLLFVALLVAVGACSDSRREVGRPFDASRVASPLVTTLSSLAVGRLRHTATLLPSGKILIAGGQSGTGGTTSAELYDPITATFTSTGTMTAPRVDHTATLLRTGLVLVVGGTPPTSPLATTELYDPETGAFTPGPPMMVGRAAHTATLLTDGRVFVAGGTAAADVAEVFDPTTKKFSSTASITSRRQHTATRLPSGEVLLVGGVSGIGNSLASPVAEIFDSKSGQFRVPSGALTPRSLHTTTLVSQGKVLVAGGVDGSGLTRLGNAELYDPANGQVTLLTMAPRAQHAAAVLPSGLVVLFGGWIDSPALEQFDDTVGAIVARSETLATNRELCSATLLPSGDVALIGGGSIGVITPSTPLQTAELFAAPIGTLTLNASSSLPAASVHARLATLPDGMVVVSGGVGNSSAPSTALDTYDTLNARYLGSHAMTTGRRNHTATSVGDGTILLAGGSDSAAPGDTAELFDGVQATTIVNLLRKRARHVAVRLISGKVLIAGGTDGTDTTAELYDPVSRTFTATGKMTEPRADAVATLLPTGDVLIAGGTNTSTTALASAETYDPRTGTFAATGSMTVGRNGHAAALLATGNVLVAGGGVASADLYDPAARTFRPTTTPMGVVRTGLSATLLPSGKVVVLGGTFAATATASDEVYDPSIDRFVLCKSSVLGLTNAPAILLTTGDVLSVGGSSQGRFFGTVGFSLWSAETSKLLPSRAPTLATLPKGASASGTLAIAGTALVGDYEASGGTSQSSPTDNPIALWMPFGGGLLTGALRPWTSTTATWNIPRSLLTGPAMLFVATNGAVGPAQILDVAPASQGSACTQDLECSTLHCADGVCCDTPCQGLCLACSAKKRGAGTDGACLPVQAALDPRSECLAQDVSTCGRSGGCNGAGACATFADGTQCGPFGECSKGACASVTACVDDATVRDANGASRSCAPFRCRDGACVDRCSSTGDCTAGTQCTAAGNCEAPSGDAVTPPGCVCHLGRSGGSRQTGVSLGLALLTLAVLVARRARSGPACAAPSRPCPCRSPSRRAGRSGMDL